MQTDNKFFNDFATIFTSMMGNAQGLTQEALQQMQQCFATYAMNAGFVKSQDVVVLENRILSLEEKIASLETQLATMQTSPQKG